MIGTLTRVHIRGIVHNGGVSTMMNAREIVCARESVPYREGVDNRRVSTSLGFYGRPKWTKRAFININKSFLNINK